MVDKKYDSNQVDPERFKNIDDYFDSFAITHQVSSELLFGIEDAVRNPFLSLVIPTYDRKELLREALESVAAQKNVEYSYEIIVVDNTPFANADKETPALRIVRELQGKRVLYYHNDENIGSGYNWNRGVELARGKWICFLHDDDILSPNALNEIGKMISDEELYHYKKPLGYIHARRSIHSNSVNRDVAISRRIGCYKEFTRIGCLINGHTGTGSPSCGTVILKEAYVKYGGINYSFGPTADAILGYQIMKDYTVIRSNEILGCYRWECNESQKEETVKKLVYSDYLFQKYREQKDIIGKIWGLFFGRAQYNNNVRLKLATPGLKTGSIKKSDLDFIEKYHDFCFISQAILMIIQQLYKFISFIKGCIRYRICRNNTERTTENV